MISDMTVQKIEKTLRRYQKKLAKKQAELEKFPDIQDDTEWVNEYHNLNGWIEALEYVLRLDNSKKA